MKRWKRIVALLGVVALLALYAMTMIFAFRKDEASRGLFFGSIAATIVIPVILYFMLRIGESGKDKWQESLRDESGDESDSENE